MLQEALDPQPFTPLDPYRGPYGGAKGVLYEGGYLMSLAPKCDMFLKSP